MSRSFAARRRGFTLLELIIVLAVLAALAALVVPILGWVRDQAKFATAAAGAAEVMNNLETYKAATGKYPDRFDSLVSSGTTRYSKVSATTYYGGVQAATTSNTSYYLTNGGGITQVLNHDEAAVDPNASTDSAVPTAVGSSNLFFIATSVTIPSDPTDPLYNAVQKIVRVIRTAYPNQGTATGGVAIPTGHQLVALGIGSRLSAVGTTMTSAPLHGGAAVGKYGRYIALFDVSPGPTGRGKIQLKMIVDSEFEILAKNVANYQGSGPVEDAATYTAP